MTGKSLLYDEFEHFRQNQKENTSMDIVRFIQPNNDPLALVSDASVQQYPTQSSKSPQPSKEPSPADNFQLDQETGKLWFKMSVKIQCDNQGDISEKLMQEEMAVPKGDSRYRDYFKDKIATNAAQESGAVLMKNRSLFLAGEQLYECDAFNYDVDEGPTLQTMFMANLTSEDLIYDEAGPSYDSNNTFEVQYHDTFVDNMDEYHEVYEMQKCMYVEDIEEHVCTMVINVSSVRNDALMSILDEMLLNWGCTK
ncbi:hypothetical protein Tco_1147015 [Tanacetum coccineum]